MKTNVLRIMIATRRRANRAVLAAALICLSGAALAQNLFSPAAFVNDGVITNYEVSQRASLLEFLGTSGDLQEISLERLVNERLQLQATARAGITVTGDEITEGIDEFATRLEISGDQLLTNIGQVGVAPDSFRDFVHVGAAWRKLVRSRFGPPSRATDSEIDRAIALSGTQGSAEVLISEIFLPTNTPENLAVTLELAPQIARLTTVADFSEAARRFSAGPSRQRGGVVNQWVPINNLPPQMRDVLLAMKPGQITEPIEIPNALAMFQLRAFRETAAPASRNSVLDYAAYFVADQQAALDVQGRADTCDDLYGIARNRPPETLVRTELPQAEIPTNYALELAKLDPGESSIALTRPGDNAQIFLMLCGRNRSPDTEISRDQVRSNLTNRRLNGFAEAYLDELRANATIRFP